MTSYSDIGVTAEGHVTIVELKRPPQNFFDHSLIRQIADAFDQADGDSACRAIVLAAEGKHFCAGANFGSGDGDGSDEFTEEGFRNTTGLLYREAARLFTNSKPIVGAIQGAAVGGGLGLALVPDFRVGCDATRFAANFVKLGIHQGFGLSVTLPRLIGAQAASMMLLTGRRIAGAEALELGLLDELVAADEVRSAALALAQEIAGNAPLAVSSVRATLRGQLAEEVARATEHELKEQQWLRATDDAREGIRAVAERRPGRFRGR
jgi:enoyl-CoA hydratase/carnithine racemase